MAKGKNRSNSKRIRKVEPVDGKARKIDAHPSTSIMNVACTIVEASLAQKARA
jgi:hypothetical protein